MGMVMSANLPPRSGIYRLGVFGGMMDPPHIGHIAAVAAAREALSLDRVMVVPTGIPPHRKPSKRTPATRLDLAVRAFADLEHVVVSDTEVERANDGDIGYMADTLKEFLDLPQELGYSELIVEAVLIVGADQLPHFEAWHRWEWIRDHVEIGVLLRPELIGDATIKKQVEKLRAQGARISDPIKLNQAISSSELRASLYEGKQDLVKSMVPNSIIDDVFRLYPEFMRQP